MRFEYKVVLAERARVYVYVCVCARSRNDLCAASCARVTRLTLRSPARTPQRCVAAVSSPNVCVVTVLCLAGSICVFTTTLLPACDARRAAPASVVPSRARHTAALLLPRSFPATPGHPSHLADACMRCCAGHVQGEVQGASLVASLSAGGKMLYNAQLSTLIVADKDVLARMVLADGETPKVSATSKVAIPQPTHCRPFTAAPTGW